ncbi:MAG: DUF4293 domain-containing protein [Thermonemataceae bacterium]|nr:DUF4293 domain-containing protein [Thermonemataceae bacterium]
MIQRIQSVFLGTMAILMALFFFLPVWEKQDKQSGEQIIINSLGMIHSKGETIIQEKDAVYIFILAFASVVVSVLSLFSYKNRPRQILLGLVNSLLIAIAIVASALLIADAEKILSPAERGSFKIGMFLPIAALVLNMLANRFIRKDENLVRSADRLR